jgi:hypothetical protein
MVVPWHSAVAPYDTGSGVASGIERDSKSEPDEHKQRIKDQFDEIFVCERAHCIE